MKTRKAVTMLAAAAMAVGALSMGAFAEESEIKVAYMAKNVVDAFAVTMNNKAASPALARTVRRSVGA